MDMAYLQHGSSLESEHMGTRHDRLYNNTVILCKENT